MNEDTMQLTIITPVFDGAAHVDACVRGVAAQWFDGLEHLVVDGGSRDGTVDLLKALAAEFRHLRWISEPDHGQADAMNKGRERARGGIIGVLNVDDRYEPGVLPRIPKFFHEAPIPTLLVGNCKVCEPAGRVIYVNRPRRLTIDALLMGFEHPVNPVAYFYHPSLHDRVGGFDLDDHYSLDVAFLYRAIQDCNIHYVNEELGSFVLWPESKTVQDKAANRSGNRVKALKQRILYQLPLGRRLRILLARPFVVGARKVVNTINRPQETFCRYAKRLLRQRSSPH